MNNNHTKQSTGVKECSLAQKTLSGGVMRGFLARILAAWLLLCICFTANAQISGPSSVCTGSTITLTNPTTGGTWNSDNTAVATVDLTTGDILGILAGTATISYTSTSGVDTRVVTVNETPSAISGPPSICISSSATYTNSVSGGTWSSYLPYFIDINTTSGVAIPYHEGGGTYITYTLPSGCYTSVNVTVDGVPPLEGIAGACVGGTTTLVSTLSFYTGTWSSSATGIATVGSSTGIVTGVSAGTSAITFMMASGCYGVYPVTISPAPAAISGANSVCAGATTTFSNTVSGGLWSSSNNAAATVGSTTGIVTGIAYGVPTITYAMGDGCYAIKSLTINPTPPDAITGNGMLCIGETSLLNSAPSGGTWSSDNTAIATISSTGLVTAVSRGSTLVRYTISTSCGMATTTRILNVGQATEWEWANAVTTTGGFSETGNYGQTPIISDAYGNTYVISKFTAGTATFGSFTFSTSNASNIVVAKYNSAGYCLWAKTFGADYGTQGNAIALDASGYVYTTGQFQGVSGTSYPFGSGSITGTGRTEGFILKYDDMGNEIWARQTTGGTGINFINGLYTDASGNCYVTGQAGSTGVTFGSTAPLTGAGMFAAKYNNSGTALWATSITSRPEAMGLSIDVDATGNAFIGGWMQGTETISTVSGPVTLTEIGWRDALVTKLDPSGVCQWVKQYGGPNTTLTARDMQGIARLIKVTNAGEIYIAGEFGISLTLGSIVLNRSASAPRQTAFVAKLDNNGDPIWAKQALNDDYISYCYGMAMNATGDIYLAGKHQGPMDFGGQHFSGAGLNGFVAKFDATGNCNWGTSVGSGYADGDPTFTGITLDNSENVYVAGFVDRTVAFGCASATSPSSYNAFTAKLTNICPTSVSVCVGNSITISSPVSGGTFSSSDTCAIIDGTTGVLIGHSAGTATVTYSAPYACQRITNVTVYGTPTLTGITSLCTGATTTLTASSTGGAWSSGAPAIATVGSASGVVTGIAYGTASISYSLGGGCYSTHVLTVNPFPPSPITGNLNLCTGDVVTLSSTPAGGTWSSSNSAVATISGGGGVTVTGSGSSLIMYSISTPCGVASTSAMLNVNQANKWEWAYSAGATGQSLMDFVGNSSPMATDASGNTYVTGRFTGTTDFGSFTVSSGTSYQSAAFVAKYNSAGVCQWVKTLSGASPSFPYNNAGRNIGVDASGNCYVAGYLSEAAGATVAFGSDVLTGNGANQFYLVKYDANGNEIWARQPTMGTSGSDGLQSLATDASGNCFLAGYTTYDNITFGSTSTLSPGSFVAKYDASGNAIWATRLGAGYLTIPYAVTSDASGACYVTGNKEGTQVFATTSPTTLSAIGDRDVFVGKIDASGVFQWVRQFGFSGTSLSVYRRDAYGKTIKADGSGNIFVAGDFYGGLTVGSTTYTLPATIATGVFITKLDGSGNPIWVKSNNGSGQMIFGNAMTLSATGDPVLTGVSVGPNNFGPATGPQMTGDNNVYVAKFSSATGDCNWVRTSVVPDYYGNAEVYGIGTDASDNIYIGGHTRNSTATFGCATTANTSSLAVYLAKLGPGCGTITPAGATPVCMGSSTTLTDVTPGGTWYTSSPAVAVDMTTGDITTLSPGTAIVSYTTRSGCIRTTTIAVNPLPAAITGSLSICEGSLQTLSSATPGGEWTSGDYDVVIVGSGTGIVTGIGPGVTDIIYTITGTGCARSVTVTVNAAAPNSGGGSVCAGQSLALINTITGGAWTSGNTAIATVGSTTGIVTGVAGGVANITYTNPSGCRSVSTVTVVALSPISGPGTVCQSQSVTLINAAPGGTWTSTDGSVATINTLTGVVNGIAPGVVTISYTISGLGCSATHTLSVNPFAPISGPTSVCLGQTVTLINAATGGVWSSNNSAIASIGSVSGIATGVAGGIATISYNLGSCRATQLLTVNTISAISGLASVCQGQTITLTNAGTGLWTSNDDAMATVGSTSGVVTGVTAGVAIITYTLPTGCFATKTLTINALAPIAGPTSVCIGSTITLTDAIGGGTWLSGNTTRATIGSTSGIVTGVAAGTLPISYTVGSCRAITTVTVNTVSAITGAASVCQGQTRTLTAVAGGIWSSNDNTIATIGSTTGVVSGVNTGIVTLSYTMATGCYTTKTMTVNALAPIIGSSSVCLGQTTTLTNTLSGGIWTSGNTTRATVGSVSGIVTGIAAGSAPISYTIGGCRDIVTITVNTLSAITGTASVCQGLTTTLTSVGAGLWNSANTGIATVGSTSGVVTGVNAGTTVISFTLATGCTAVRTVTVNPLSPISGLSSVCIGQTITLTNATPGGLWTSGTPARATVGSVSGVVTGISSGITLVSYTIGSCRATQAVTVSSLGAITGPNRVCENQNINLTNIGGGGIWTSSNTAIGTVVSNTGAVTGITAGTFIISYTIGTSCTATYPVTVNPLAVITGPAFVCVGQSVTLSDATPGGSWTSGNTNIAIIGSGTGVATGVLLGGNVNISYTVTNTGCRTTRQLQVYRLSVIAGPTSVCEGQTITVTDAEGGGTWSSSNPGVAAIGSTNGVINGVTAGTSVISYILPTTCTATSVITVNPLSPITGANSVCMSTPTTLSNATPGGLWTSTNPTIARVGSTTGLVTGLNTGITNITYTIAATGCRLVVPMTVNPCRFANDNSDLNTGTFDVRIFPNPNKGSFNLNGYLGSSKTEEVTVEIVNMLGQVVYTNKYTVADGRINEQIQLNSSLANGMYLLNFNAENEKRVFHFVLQQ